MRLQQLDTSIKHHLKHISEMPAPQQSKWPTAIVIGLLVLAVLSGLVLARNLGLTGAAVVGSAGSWVFTGIAVVAIIASVFWGIKAKV